MPRTKTDQRLPQFAQRFGQPHVDLACHAAFPIAFTPDLLYRLWAHFRTDVQGQPLHIPWVAVADVLLSPLCDEVGFDLYEIDTDLRTALLNRLKADPRFGPLRLQELADFLLIYHQASQLHSDDPDVQELAQVQRWNALAQGQPTQVVRDLAQRLVGVPGSDGAEWGRMAELMARLPLPDGEAQTLLHYAQGMARLTQGDMQPALTHFQQLPGRGRRGVKVAGVTLRLPEVVQQQVQPASQISRRRWLQWAGWSTAGVLGTVALGRTITRKETPPQPEVNLNGVQRQTVVFANAEMAFVDAQGQELLRQQRSVVGEVWSRGDMFSRNCSTGLTCKVLLVRVVNFGHERPAPTRRTQ
ncbi:MAG: hypothetical protein ACFBSF_13890 [Leptolyngbyaceae cyanobacterium]